MTVQRRLQDNRTIETIEIETIKIPQRTRILRLIVV